jgi:hypothetical protein
MNYIQLAWAGLTNMLAWALAHPDEAAQTGVIIAAGLGALRRWAIAKKADRFAQFVDALRRSGGYILNAIQKAPPGTDVEALKARLMREELARQLAEYATTVKKIGATPEKAAGMLGREMDRIEAERPIVNIIREAAPVPPLREVLDGLAARGG